MFLSTFARNLVNFISLLISYPCALFSIYYILAISFLYAVYRRCYWMSRRYFNLNVIKNKDISKTYSIISIINQIGVIISAYCGSLFLDLICLIPGLNIKMMIYLTLTLMTISGFFTLKNKKEIYEENW